MGRAVLYPAATSGRSDSEAVLSHSAADQRIGKPGSEMTTIKLFRLASRAKLIALFAFALSAHAQAPTPPPSPNPTSVNEQGGQLQQITVTGYVVPRVGEG